MQPATVKAATSKAKVPKVLASIELKRGMTGGVIATHRYEGYEHEPTPHDIEGSTSAVASHLQEHMGLSEEPKDQSE